MLPLAPVHSQVTSTFLIGGIIAPCFGYALIGVGEDCEFLYPHCHKISRKKGTPQWLGEKRGGGVPECNEVAQGSSPVACINSDASCRAQGETEGEQCGGLEGCRPVPTRGRGTNRAAREEGQPDVPAMKGEYSFPGL